MLAALGVGFGATPDAFGEGSHDTPSHIAVEPKSVGITFILSMFIGMFRFTSPETNPENFA